MSNLTHLFKVGQKVVWMSEECGQIKKYNGTVKETYPDHIIVDIPAISDHCYFEQGFNLDEIYPDYNF